MGYLLLILATLSWSFVGILVKSASTMVDSTTITFARFSLGIVFLGILLLVKDRKLGLKLDLRWIWIGALGKSCNYLFENMAISIGYSYGNILVGPIQTVILLLVSVFIFKEHVSLRGWIAGALCIMGVLCISWNGLPLHTMLASNGLTTLLFVLSAIGTAFHVLSQKMLVQSMESGPMNFSIFFLCSILMAVPLPFQAHATGGTVPLWGIAALVGLGLITGLSFNWFAEALKRVSFAAAVIVSNSGALFTILWSYLFFHDRITGYILSGVGLFIAGLLLLNWPMRKARLAARKPGQTASDAG
ncbi:DMT family transporter [Paenibacillus rigui]|uniref:EamA family transporter n=1 Tax=Paenibacillus rigui TaxID=554312 RepID=A0A229UJG3_9BACL|nr:DMT family transporter [Paenibacillus rigui]OXM83536.1 EamA family transporter [Paenibacillus rigui]